MTKPSSIAPKGQRVGLQFNCDQGGGSFYPEPEVTPVDLDFAPGDVVAGRHVIQYYLADGPLAAMYVARHASVPTLAYVLKVLKREFASIPEVVEQFRVEATSIAQLRDPHSVRITDMGLLPDGRPFICREFCRGIGLPQLMERFGPLPPTLVHRIAVGVLSSLAEAHSLGVIHRDIRPLGLILTEEIVSGDVRCRVLDFGTAHIDASSRLYEQARATNPSIMMCAPQYASPELLRGKVSKSVDTYALGLTLAELLEGKPVVESGPFLKVAYAQLAETEFELGEIAAKSPLAGLIRRAIRKNPAERYEDAGEMLDDLLRNYPVTYSPYELLWTRWSAIGDGLVVTPRPAIHMAKTLTQRTSALHERDEILLEEAHDVLLNELPTAMRLAAIRNDDALFAAVDRISHDTLDRDAVLGVNVEESSDFLLPRSSLFEKEILDDSSFGTQRVRKPNITSNLPTPSNANSHAFTDVGRLRTLQAFGEREFSSSFTAIRMPAPQPPVKNSELDEDPFAALEGFPDFSADAFVDKEPDLFDFDDFAAPVSKAPESAPSAGMPESTSPDQAAAPAQKTEVPSYDAATEPVPRVSSDPVQASSTAFAISQQANGNISPAEAIASLGKPPTDPVALEEFVAAVKKLRRIEARQNFALMLRGALITVLLVLILWTIANVVG